MNLLPVDDVPPVPGTGAPRVTPGAFLTLHYRLSGPDGAALVDTFAGKPATVTLGAGQFSPALEACLMGLAEGEDGRFELPAGDAFGPRNPQLVQRVARALVRGLSDAGAAYAVGDVVQFPDPSGQGSYAGVLRAAGEDWFDFDFNHPLAGLPVRLEVRVLGVLP